nr:TonB family protein [uncultured Cohaesibacter sp.]
MRSSGLLLFIALSLVVHGVGAWYFVKDPEVIREERGAGAAALEIGGLFDSVAQDAVEPAAIEPVPSQARVVTPTTATQVEPIAPVRASPAPVVPQQAVEVPIEELVANDALSEPDILKPRETKTVEPEPLEPSEPQKMEAREPDARAVGTIKSVEAPKEIAELPQIKPKQQAKPDRAKTPRNEQQATVASRRGGNVASDKGQKGATGGNGGKGTSNGNAETSNYMGKVRSRVASKKRYPNAARRRGETGTSVIRFVVAQNGVMSGLNLVRSSGSAILDDAALSMAQRAAPFPTIPASSGKASISFTLPISFAKN